MYPCAKSSVIVFDMSLRVLHVKQSLFPNIGIEDKLIATNGYCIMITDEGASFLSDLKRYETKHESYISLLNQLFDGKGDKMTLAKNVERPVPRNSTSLSIGVQQKSFCDAIYSLSETLWLDNGFGERFIFSAAKPYRYIHIYEYKCVICKISQA